jgi:hypothetical protein
MCLNGRLWTMRERPFCRIGRRRPHCQGKHSVRFVVRVRWASGDSADVNWRAGGDDRPGPLYSARWSKLKVSSILDEENR